MIISVFEEATLTCCAISGDAEQKTRRDKAAVVMRILNCGCSASCGAS